MQIDCGLAGAVDGIDTFGAQRTLKYPLRALPTAAISDSATPAEQSVAVKLEFRGSYQRNWQTTLLGQ